MDNKKLEEFPDVADFVVAAARLRIDAAVLLPFKDKKFPPKSLVKIADWLEKMGCQLHGLEKLPQHESAKKT